VKEERGKCEIQPYNNKGPGRTRRHPFLYVRIESLIRNRILNGQLEPGEKLPQKRFDQSIWVSQITIRKALSNLEQERAHRSQSRQRHFCVGEIAFKEKFVITNEVYNILEDADRYE